MNDDFWFENPKIIFNENRLKEFFPINEMTDIEKLNSIFRLSIYLGIILAIIMKNYMYLYIIIISGLFTIVIFRNKKEDFGFFKNNKTTPTKNNPFMNYNYITDPREKPKSVTSYDNKNVKEEINNYFNKNLFRDVSDLYQKNNSQRQFYSMPCTDIVNEQTKFAKWLYHTDKTCKEDGIKCATY